MTPTLLTVMKMQGLESLHGGLMARETGPFMVARLGTELSLAQIGHGWPQSLLACVGGCGLELVAELDTIASSLGSNSLKRSSNLLSSSSSFCLSSSSFLI
jgi:hypothetical protein